MGTITCIKVVSIEKLPVREQIIFIDYETEINLNSFLVLITLQLT